MREAQNDFQHKVSLLAAEVQYTERLRQILGQVQEEVDLLSQAKEEAVAGRFDSSLDRLDLVKTKLRTLQPYADSSAFRLIEKSIREQQQTILETVTSAWQNLLKTDSALSCVVVEQTGHSTDQGSLTIEQAAQILLRLGALDASIAKFARAFDEAIVRPRFSADRYQRRANLKRDKRRLSVNIEQHKTSAKDAVADVSLVVDFTVETLPPIVSAAVSQYLMPSLTTYLIDSWLNELMPVALEEMLPFEEVASSVKELTLRLSNSNSGGQHELEEWTEQIPKTWLAKRRQASLAAVRVVLLKKPYQTMVVERTEKQVLSNTTESDKSIIHNLAIAQHEQNTSTQMEHLSTGTIPGRSSEEGGKEEEEEEDASAWDVADDDPLPNDSLTDGKAVMSPNANLRDDDNNDDDADAWGWDDQSSVQDPTSPVSNRKRANTVQSTISQAMANGHVQLANGDEQEVTLKETYTITGVPDQLRDLIKTIIHDADTLRSPKFADSTITPAVVGLYSLPTLAIAGFRALAPACYASHSAANMLLYNDCMRLATELEELAAQQLQLDSASELPQYAWPSSRMKMADDVQSVQSFGRRAYGKEMDSQRTVLRDLLDGAQGFANCTTAPFSTECADAVSAVIDRMRVVATQWQDILSHSALLQSLGSLLSMVIAKVIADIEDLGDISEPESKQLSRYCDDISSLRDLFAAPTEQGRGDVCGVYTPLWFKFQYLNELLAASLADIRYLWSEGELKLEYEADELVDLVQALFADSDHRRRTISEIRRS